MTKETENKNGALKVFRESEVGALIEHFDSKIDLVVEGHAALDKKIDKNHEEFKEFRQEVNYKFDVVFQKFDEVDQQFNKVDRRFDKVEDELHIIRDELKEKVGRDEFVLLEKRVAILERSKNGGSG